ncbi:rRNA biogenesis protein rrp36 [Umbelopsis sp. WA50703]
MAKSTSKSKVYQQSSSDEEYPDEFQGFSEEEFENGEENEEESFDESEEGGEDEEEEDGDDSDDEKMPKQELEELKRSLAHVSFEKLAEIQSKIGMKEFHKNFRKSGSQVVEEDENTVKRGTKGDRAPKKKDAMKREAKNKPMEMSSKRAVGRRREVVELPAAKRRDPRFDQMSGKLNQDLFEKSYDFLDKYKQDEEQMLKAQMLKEKDPEEKERLQKVLLRMVSQRNATKDAKRKQALQRERKRTEQELVKQGKKPFYLKKSDQKKLELIDKFKQLGDKNVDKILEKRRKRNATKDHKKVPFKRRKTEM